MREIPRSVVPLPRPALAAFPPAAPMPPPEAAVPKPPPAPATLKIKVKIGGAEFQAEGPADVVQAQLDEFKRLAGIEPRSHSSMTRTNSGLSVVPPRRRQGPRKTDQ